MYICIYVYMYICICMCVYIYIYIYIYPDSDFAQLPRYESLEFVSGHSSCTGASLTADDGAIATEVRAGVSRVFPSDLQRLLRDL